MLCVEKSAHTFAKCTLVLRGVAQSPDINSHERLKTLNLVGSNNLDPPKNAMAPVAYSSRGLQCK